MASPCLCKPPLASEPASHVKPVTKQIFGRASPGAALEAAPEALPNGALLSYASSLLFTVGSGPLLKYLSTTLFPLVIKYLATHTHVHMTLGLGMDLLGLYCPGLHTWNIPLVAICQPEAKASFCSCQLLTVGDGSAGSTRPLLQDRHASAGAGHLDMAGPVACTPFLPSLLTLQA